MDDDCAFCLGEGTDRDCDLLPCPHCGGTGGAFGYESDEYSHDEAEDGE